MDAWVASSESRSSHSKHFQANVLMGQPVQIDKGAYINYLRELKKENGEIRKIISFK